MSQEFTIDESTIFEDQRRVEQEHADFIRQLNLEYDQRNSYNPDYVERNF